MKLETIEFEGVIESHIKIFMFLAMKYVNSLIGYDRNDLIQEQKLACYRAIRQYDQIGNIGSFIYAVSENRLLSLYKLEHRSKRRPRQLVYLDTQELETAGLQLSDGQATGDDAYYISELKERIDDIAVECLSDFEYYLYTHIVVGNQSHQQVGIDLNKEEKQIRNGLSRIRRKLSEKRDLIINDVWYN